MHLHLAVAAFFLLAVLPLASAEATTGSTSRAHDNTALVVGVRDNNMVMSRELRNAITAKRAIPAFSRQTGLPCSACHNQFPQLTPFGRKFKLNGYTLTGLPTIGQPGDSAGKESLKLLSTPGIAAMLVSSLTQTNKAVPGTQNGTVALPDQLSIFAAGAITPNIGLFSQFTYAARDGSFGIDNVDLRYADHGTLGDHELIYGVTLHNNPTVQDVWNTVPAWSFPFMSSSSAPSSIASTLIDGGLSQQVVGLGAYSLYDNLLYTEFTAYRSSPQGFSTPLDSTSVNTASGVIPYWRVALQHETATTSLMLGTFGFDAHLYPTGISGPTNHYTDIAVDGQIEQRKGSASWIGRASFIHERQQLTATQAAGGADNVDQNVSTARASVAYLPNMKYSLTLGYFQTTGSADSTLYAPDVMIGSRLGRPNTSGAIGELTYNAWQNARIGLHYTAYREFNGTSSAYDVVGGRNASDNNTLYLYLWTAF